MPGSRLPGMLTGMQRLSSALLVVLLAGVALGACGTSVGLDSCLGPVRTVEPAGLIAIPQLDTRVESDLGACPWMVEFDGKLYNDSQVSQGLGNGWTITADDLTRIGHATRATLSMPAFVDDTVFSVDGVDPAAAIAVRPGGPDTDVLVFVEGNKLPETLCPYLTSATTEQAICLPAAGGGRSSP